MTAKPVLVAIYLLTVSVAAFTIPGWFKPYGVSFLIGYQIFLLALTGNLSTRTFWAVWKLKFLFLFIILAYGLIPDGSSAPRWHPYPNSFLSVSWPGAGYGLLLSSQIALVVLASHLVCKISTPQMLAEGLRRLRFSPLLAESLSLTLSQLQEQPEGGRGMGRGRGRGMGGGGGGGGRGMGGGRNRDQAPQEEAERLSLWQRIRLVPQLIGGQVDSLGQKVHARLQAADADDGSDADSDSNSDLARDAKVIAGIAAIMLSLKALKFLPGIPFASGHKAIVFIPLYLVAADQTKSRWGATNAGLVMGFIALLAGDGRYGVFEVLKHLAPGLCIDLLWPLVRRWRHSFVVLTALGVAAAIARTSTELALTLALGLRWELYAFPAAKLIPNLLAGGLSGLVSAPLLKFLAKNDGAEAEPAQDQPRSEGEGDAPATGGSDTESCKSENDPPAACVTDAEKRVIQDPSIIRGAKAQ